MPFHLLSHLVVLAQLRLPPLAGEEPTDVPTDLEEVGARVTSVAEWVAEIDWVAVAIRAITFVAILLVAWAVNRVGRRAVRRWVSRATVRGLGKARDARVVRAELRARTLGDVMADAVSVFVWFVALVTALGQIGIDLRALLAGAGIVGIAIGFGAQNLVKDFFSGFFILLEDQYGIGDVIAIDEQGQVSGLVEDISLRVTRLRSLDGTVWFVPNGEIRYLANRSKEWARALVDFEVGYGEDPERVMDVIREVAARMRQDPELGPKILEDVEILGVEALGESGITIRTFIKTVPLEQWVVSRRFRQEVKREFDALGIEIPFPHRKLIIEQGQVAPTPPGEPASSEAAPKKRARGASSRSDA